MNTSGSKTVPFLLITFGASWSLAVGYRLLGGQWNTPSAVAVATVYMFTPLIATVIVQKLIAREPIRKPLAIFFRPNRWFVVAWLVPVVLAFAAMGMSLLWPNVGFSPDMEGFFERMADMIPPEKLDQAREQMDYGPVAMLGIMIAQTLVAGITINALAAFGEEIGWRGLLYNQLKHLGFWPLSLLTGAIWGIWHAPLIIQGHNYPDNPVLGVVLMTLFCIAWAPIFTYIRLKSGSVIGAAILHGSINASVGLSLVFLRGGSAVVVGMLGIAGIVAIGLANVGIYVARKKDQSSEDLAETSHV
jgi:membrane protease YdiL (CAAX protease family)